MSKKTILNFIEKYHLFIVAILIIVVLGLIAFLFLFREKEIPQPLPSAQVPETVSEIVKPGTIGEAPEKIVKEDGEVFPEESSAIEFVELPPIIFNTTGVIITVGDNMLVVRGSGSNFADQGTRNLTVLFTDSTKTIEPDRKTKYQGLEGLKHLEIGMGIALEGETNIRGKTEIIAGYINIIQ